MQLQTTKSLENLPAYTYIADTLRELAHNRKTNEFYFKKLFN